MKNSALKIRCTAVLNKLCLMLLLAGLAQINCTEKNSPSEPDDSELVLRYDKEQDSSPFLAAGRYEATARFTSAQIGNLAGREVVEVRYYISTKPEVCRIKIYGPGSANTPGTLLYSSEVTSATMANQWNVHALTQSVRLTSNDIWISVEFSHSARQATIGCDPGPAIDNADWLWSASDNNWMTLRQRASININWNLRAAAK